MSIHPTLLNILRGLPWRTTCEIPPGVAADLRDACKVHPALCSVTAIHHLGSAEFESPDGLERVYVETQEHEISWVESIEHGGGRDHAAYKCVVMMTSRRTVPHLSFQRVSQGFTSSAAADSTVAMLKSEGWQEV